MPAALCHVVAVGQFALVVHGGAAIVPFARRHIINGRAGLLKPIGCGFEHLCTDASVVAAADVAVVAGHGDDRDTGVAALYITHDLATAYYISDYVVVMNKGHIEQIDAPEDMYARPKTEFVARFVGTLLGRDAPRYARRLGAITTTDHTHAQPASAAMFD